MTRLLTNSIPYTFVRSGYFYFSRRVPRDLRDHYLGSRIVIGLRTRSPQKAKVLAISASAGLESYWSQIRLSRPNVVGLHLVKTPSNHYPRQGRHNPVIDDAAEQAPTMTEALRLYLDLKGKGRPKTFEASTRRACGYVFEIAGDKSLSGYALTDALKLRDHLVARGLTGSTVTRNFAHIKAIFNFACSELALDLRNPFAGVFHDRKAGVVGLQPIPISAIRTVQAKCHQLDDDIRWLIALVSDTGMRLAEAAGLSRSDLVDLDGPIPHIHLKRHPWRQLKTDSSERLIPLAGEALWAAKRILAQEPTSEFAFPRYNRGSTTSAGSASAALNKWLRDYVPKRCTMHSFRHSMRDRLRAVECPVEIADRIGGWTAGSVGQGYGNGYPLGVLADWIGKAVEPSL